MRSVFALLVLLILAGCGSSQSEIDTMVQREREIANRQVAERSNLQEMARRECVARGACR